MEGERMIRVASTSDVWRVAYKHVGDVEAAYTGWDRWCDWRKDTAGAVAWLTTTNATAGYPKD
jgi:hypothetical protein